AMVLGRGSDHIAVHVDCDKIDAAFRRSRHSLFDCLPDVEHLRVKENLLAFIKKLLDQAVKSGGELQPQPEFEKRDQPVQVADQPASLGDALDVERDDEAILDSNRDVARAGRLLGRPELKVHDLFVVESSSHNPPTTFHRSSLLSVIPAKAGI